MKGDTIAERISVSCRVANQGPEGDERIMVRMTLPARGEAMILLPKELVPRNALALNQVFILETRWVHPSLKEELEKLAPHPDNQRCC